MEREILSSGIHNAGTKSRRLGLEILGAQCWSTKPWLNAKPKTKRNPVNSLYVIDELVFFLRFFFFDFSLIRFYVPPNCRLVTVDQQRNASYTIRIRITSNILSGLAFRAEQTNNAYFKTSRRHKVYVLRVQFDIIVLTVFLSIPTRIHFMEIHENSILEQHVPI